MMRFKSIFFLAGFVLISVCIFAREKSVWQIDFRTDIYSRHLWRGDRLGDAPAIEPEISLSNDKFGFAIWGATAFDNSYEELDLILNCQVLPSLNLVLYDYYNPVPGEKNSYWNYAGNDLRHTIDLTAEYSNAKLPFSLMTSIFLYGDKDIVEGKEQFSTYIEPAYDFTLAGKDFSAFAGFTPFSGYYAGGFAFVSLGFSFSDSFQVGEKLELPFDITFCTNPHTNDTWFVIGIGIKSIRFQ